MGVQQRRLHPVVEAQNGLKRGIDARMGRKVATGQHRQAAEREHVPQEAAPAQPIQLRPDLVHAYGWFVAPAAHKLSSFSLGTVTIIDLSVRG
jgi:hypothetical protein